MMAQNETGPGIDCTCGRGLHLLWIGRARILLAPMEGDDHMVCHGPGLPYVLDDHLLIHWCNAGPRFLRPEAPGIRVGPEDIGKLRVAQERNTDSACADDRRRARLVDVEPAAAHRNRAFPPALPESRQEAGFIIVKHMIVGEQ
jgi:hypothetical protein